jgi:hypothetical protein
MGVQFTIQGGSVFNKGVQYTMDVNRPRVQFTMGFKIPYDTGIVFRYLVSQVILIFRYYYLIQVIVASA